MAKDAKVTTLQRNVPDGSNNTTVAVGSCWQRLTALGCTTPPVMEKLKEALMDASLGSSARLSMVVDNVMKR